MNGMVKVPLQFLILLIGILVYVYYIFFSGPVFFNHKTEQEILKTTYAADYKRLNNDFNAVQKEKKTVAVLLSEATGQDRTKDISLYRHQLRELEKRSVGIRNEVKSLISQAIPGTDTNDTNYIFLRFVGDTLPNGLIGLIIAIVFLSAWGSIAAALHALASSTMIDFHKRFNWTKPDMQADYKWSRFYTLAWGIFCVLVAQFAYGLGNSLIEAVNILGSLFYGTILGIFLVALMIHYVKGKAVFYGALAAEAIVLMIFYMDIISFLWLNVIGAGSVMLFSVCIQTGINYRKGYA
jgi:hypothetical protein